VITKFFKSHPAHKRLARLLDVVFLLRPTLFFPVWVMLTVGMAAARMDVSGYTFGILSYDWITLALYAGMTLISGSTFIINQIKDKDGDALNDKLFLVGNHISITQAKWIMYVSLIVGLGLTYLAGVTCIILGIVLFLVWGILYNVEPFHYKKTPVLGMVTNSLAGLVIYMTGAMFVYGSSGLGPSEILKGKMLLVAIPYILCYTATSLLTTIPDMEGDRETGALTFPLQFGKHTTILIGTIMVVLALVIGAYYRDPVSSLAALVSLPLYIIALRMEGVPEVLRAIRYSILFLALLVMSVYPLLFPGVLVVFYLSKYYYWHRFDLNYPTFEAKQTATES